MSAESQTCDTKKEPLLCNSSVTQHWTNYRKRRSLVGHCSYLRHAALELMEGIYFCGAPVEAQ
jgi:hypothetical protein